MFLNIRSIVCPFPPGKFRKFLAPLQNLEVPERHLTGGCQIARRINVV
jgi:hypothetical protein